MAADMFRDTIRNDIKACKALTGTYVHRGKNQRDLKRTSGYLKNWPNKMIRENNKKKYTIMEQPLDRICRFSQTASFWIWTLVFIFCTPGIVLFSLGYTFDSISKIFLKTGAISLVTDPEEADISINGQKLRDKTPHTLRGVPPKTYTVVFNKEGYFSYKTDIDVKPAMVTDIDVALMPNRREYEQKTLPFDLYRYFVVRRMTDEKIVCLTDKGIYICDDQFGVKKRLTSHRLSEETSQLIDHVMYASDTLLFWSPRQIWTLWVENKTETEDQRVNLVYEAEHGIRRVFGGLKKRYLIVQDGKLVKAIDIKNPSTVYSIALLQTQDGEIFYNEDSDVLYLYDEDGKTNKRVMKMINFGNNFLVKLQALVSGQNENEKNS